MKTRMNLIGNNQDEVLELDVGGVPLKVLRKLFSKVPGSDLAAYFSGLHELKLTKDGKVFLDRDGEVFKHVISWLRNNLSIAAPFENKTIQRLFESELKFWKLDFHQFNSDSNKHQSKKTKDYIKMEYVCASDPRSSSEAVQKTWEKHGPFRFEELITEGKLNFDETVCVQQKKKGNWIADGQFDS